MILTKTGIFDIIKIPVNFIERRHVYERKKRAFYHRKPRGAR